MPDSTQTDDLTVAQFQQFIHDRYYETDNARGTPSTFMWLVEEIGELATALQNHNNDNSDPAPPAIKANMEEEFADVIAWLCTLANINNVDLTHALREKYLNKDGGPEGHK